MRSPVTTGSMPEGRSGRSVSDARRKFFERGAAEPGAPCWHTSAGCMGAQLRSWRSYIQSTGESLADWHVRRELRQSQSQPVLAESRLAVGAAVAGVAQESGGRAIGYVLPDGRV
jgi:hypothetical protein